MNTSTGVISGTPTTAGTYSVLVSAANAGGTGTKAVTFTINAPAPVISSAATAGGTTGAAFTYTITASSAPITFSATGLPAGLSINSSTGLISGTPTTAGTYIATVSATNDDGTGSKQVTITISNPAGSTPYGGTAWAIPGKIEAENFDDGGEGIAYHDAEALNQGGQQRTNQGVDVETCGEGTLDVGWTGAGEWGEVYRQCHNSWRLQLAGESRFTECRKSVACGNRWNYNSNSLRTEYYRLADLSNSKCEHHKHRYRYTQPAYLHGHGRF